MVTIKQVAQRAGLSVSCISKYLKNPDSVMDSTRNVIEEAIHALNYTPSRMARSLRTRKSYCVKVIIESVRMPFYAEFYDYLYTIMKERGYTLIIQQAEESNFFIDDLNMVDGIIVCILENASLVDRIKQIPQIRDRSVPTVFMHWKELGADLPIVRLDLASGIKATIDYLLEEERIPIYYVGGIKDNTICGHKFNTYKQYLLEHGYQFDTTYVFNGEFSYDVGYKAACHMLTLPVLPKGVICSSDIAAIGVIRGLYDNDIRVPEEVRVIGYDNSLFTQTSIPALSTVCMPNYEICQTACNMLISIMNGNSIEESTFSTKLLLRES